MKENIHEFVEFIRKYENIERPDLNAFNNELYEWHGKLNECTKIELEYIEQYVNENIDLYHEILKISILSVMVFLFKKAKYTEQIIKIARKSVYLNEENKYFIYSQINSYAFRYQGILDKGGRWELRMLYRECYEEYKRKMGINKEIVPVSNRNSKVMVFFCGQFLTIGHGPTKTTLDRCKIVAENLGCKAVIINTNEMRHIIGYIPFYQPFYGNTIAQYQDNDSIGYEGYEFPYLQCSEMMPNIAELAPVINMVRQMNPYCMFLIGGESICADLCSNYFPLITVGTVPSGISTTEGQFCLKGKTITDEDKEYTRRLGLSKNYLQYCLFTSSLPPQVGSITRNEIKLSESDFVALVVGARLDSDITDEFVEKVLIPIMKKDIYIIFMGLFDSYQKWCTRYTFFKTHSVYLGFVDNVLAVNEVCDVYLNPLRTGGGTSVIEAMVKGVVPVSINFGDVALGTGELFHVRDYNQMTERVIQLFENKEYYRQMSEQAKNRADIMLDGVTPFLNITQTSHINFSYAP